MNLKKEIINGPGFSIAKINDINKFEYLRENFLHKMGIKKKGYFFIKKKNCINE